MCFKTEPSYTLIPIQDCLQGTLDAMDSHAQAYARVLSDPLLGATIGDLSWQSHWYKVHECCAYYLDNSRTQPMGLMTRQYTIDETVHAAGIHVTQMHRIIESPELIPYVGDYAYQEKYLNIHGSAAYYLRKNQTI